MSAAAAMSAIVTCSNPRSSNSAIARLDDLLARALLLALPEPWFGLAHGAHDTSLQREANMQSLQICTECAITGGMALLLGRLAGATAHHWKRSLALVVVALASLALLSSPRQRLLRQLHHARDRVPAGVRPARRALPGSCRRHRDRRLLGRGGRCASPSGPPRSPRRSARSPASRTSPPRRTR